MNIVTQINNTCGISCFPTILLVIKETDVQMNTQSNKKNSNALLSY